MHPTFAIIADIRRAGTTALSRAKTITSARGSWGLG